MADILSYFALGFITGYVWHTIWLTAIKIWAEAKKATKEWKK